MFLPTPNKGDVKELSSILNTGNSTNVIKNSRSSKQNFIDIFNKLGTQEEPINNKQNIKMPIQKVKNEISKDFIELMKKTNDEMKANVKSNKNANSNERNDNFLSYLLAKDNEEQKSINTKIDKEEPKLQKNEVIRPHHVNDVMKNTQLQKTTGSNNEKNLNEKEDVDTNKGEVKQRSPNLTNDNKSIDTKNQVITPNIEDKKDNNEIENIKKTPLGIKNTLKYGAFSAFDTLSLLKPSNGKKISELIKKADELALNLEKIKYEKQQNVVQPMPKIDSDIEVKNDKTKNELLKKEIKNIDANRDNNKNGGDSILKDVLSKETITQDNKKIDSKPVQSDKKVNNNENNLNAKEELPAQSDNLDSKEELKKQISLKKDERKVTEKNVDNKENKPVDNMGATNIRNDQSQKIFDSKETIKSFVNQIQQEIVNYKPPISKLTLELNPPNLGSVEVTITHQGKNIQVQMNANQQTMNMFIQNSSELRLALSQIGYDNIAMSFSNGSSMGFSDKEGKWQFQELNKNFDDNGNENSLDDKVANLEINIINNYA